MTGMRTGRLRGQALGAAPVLLLVLGMLLAPGRGHAQFVLYHSAHGEWTVTCARDQLTARVSCTMAAPPPRLTRQGPLATITIDEGAGAPPSISFRVGGDVDSARPVLAMIDSGVPVVAPVNRFGEGRWQGAEARSLIDAMRRGARLSLVWTVGEEPVTAQFALASFEDGLTAYRRTLATFGIAAR